MPAKNEQFLPSETSKFCIETSVCPVVTKSSKTMMLRCGGMLLAVKTVNAEGDATVQMPAGYYIVCTAGTSKTVIVK